MIKLDRRNFVKLGAITAGIAALGKKFTNFAGAMELKEGGIDFSSKTKKERKVIPSSCWQCVSRDSVLCYVEDDRLVKIEGNPKSIRNRGKLCARGQAGINQVYDPDRILYPLKRAGARGKGKWKRISWDEALDELSSKLKKLLDEGKPEKFMFHYGRMKASDSTIVNDNFLAAFGTKTIGNHTTICEGGKWTSQELVWGKHYDINDVENTNMILNFGCNVFETHTSHLQFAQRVVNAINDKKVKMYTFDVRLSNTAAKSTEWIPIKPGTDGVVALAMCNVIMKENLHNKDFIETWTNVTVEQLKKHLHEYTPEFAEKISGVPAEKIRTLAIEYAKAKPGTCISYRGAVAHYNGTENERAIKMLDAICGYIDVQGGTCHAIGPSYKWIKVEAGHPKKLDIVDGFKGDVAYPTHHVNHQIFKMIKDGNNGRPEVYMVYCHNPVYANGECQENIDVLKDESLIPYIVAVDCFLSESTALADLILPDVTYLERWTLDDMVSYEMIPEFYLRQPVVKPLGESRQFQDVVCELAKRLGLKLEFSSTEEYIKKVCAKTGIDFENLKQNGVLSDPNAKPKYGPHLKKVALKDFTDENVLLDEETGTYWNWKKSKAKSKEEAEKKGYTKTKDSYKGYVGQRIGDYVYTGFKPDSVNKSGKFEIYSKLLKDKKFAPMPSFIPIPEHQNMKRDELILTTYKVNVQTQSRTQNCRWLTEIYHDNPAWINPVTAAERGINNLDKIKVRSKIGEIITKAKVTSGIVPGVIAISYHCGHWEYGEFASGKKSSSGHECVPDCKYVWWKEIGVHPNWIIPNSPDPISGQQRWMDTVVTVEKV